jgi:exodeoxyribonuclease V alpha subunit
MEARGMLTELQGQIERITYTNEDNGFTIAKVKVEGRKDLVTVVGTLLAPMPGEIIKTEGEWTRHRKYGEQFKVVHYDVIENDLERLAEVEGIGTKRTQMIKRAWDEQREIRDVMIFLQAHGVGSGYATRIFKHYGDQSIEVVKKNPYRLATDIFGIGFLTADRIAERLGFAKDSEVRAEAGVLYVLNQLSDEGHVYYPYEPLVEKCKETLQVDREVIVKGFGTIALDKRIVIEDLKPDIEEFRENNKAVYLTKFHFSEKSVAARLKTLLNSLKSIRSIDTEKAITWVQSQLDITLAPRQVEAVRSAVRDKVLVITGGPGTGKTTIVNAVLKIFKGLGVRIMLAAPTGRAAKRMSEATGHPAKTIHRMLEYSFKKGGFQKNEENPLRCDLLVVDEASMIDTVLMHHLLKAVPPEATFILVGDSNQLPSVGPGNVLKDIIGSGVVKVVELNEIFRQAQESSIIVNAHRINSGILPRLKRSGRKLDDFYFIEQEDPEEVLRIILELVKERIPNRFGLNPIDEIQVLTPMHRGVVGAGNLNVELQKVLNPGEADLTRGGMDLRVNDKVMQIVNNYDKEVFNGDIGRITKINSEIQEVAIAFDGCEVAYEYPDLDEIVLAYAVSVHKSQGSEYPAVIVPILTQHYVLLQRNLIYTAVTRGRRLVVVVGTKKALAIGVKNDKMQKRYTNLRQWLR